MDSRDLNDARANREDQIQYVLASVEKLPPLRKIRQDPNDDLNIEHQCQRKLALVKDFLV